MDDHDQHTECRALGSSFEAHRHPARAVHPCRATSGHVPARDQGSHYSSAAQAQGRSSDPRAALAATYAEQLAATLQSVDAYKSTATLARHMAEAMRTRAVIEQAKGILMADHRITDEQAFQRLTELSQHANVKLRDGARRIVDQRSQPDN
jgi:hypothetical protein